MLVVRRDTQSRFHIRPVSSFALALHAAEFQSGCWFLAQVLGTGANPGVSRCLPVLRAFCDAVPSHSSHFSARTARALQSPSLPARSTCHNHARHSSVTAQQVHPGNKPPVTETRWSRSCRHNNLEAEHLPAFSRLCQPPLASTRPFSFSHVPRSSHIFPNPRIFIFFCIGIACRTVLPIRYTEHLAPVVRSRLQRNRRLAVSRKDLAEARSRFVVVRSFVSLFPAQRPASATQHGHRQLGPPRNGRQLRIPAVKL